MFRKIVSGAESGVELAAMDLALRLGMACGGWTPKEPASTRIEFNRKYNLRATPAIGYQQAVEHNVQDADGLLLITRGGMNPKSRYAAKTALSHQKQLLHADLQQHSQFEAASLISSWVKIQRPGQLYITGTNAVDDQTIYQHTLKILETAFYLDFVKSGIGTDFRQMNISTSQLPLKDYPRTIEAAVKRLKTDLPLKDRTLMANLQANELDQLRDGLGEYIKQAFGLYTGNEALTQACAQAGNLQNPLPDEACHVILRALWADLQLTHKLRVIK